MASIQRRQTLDGELRSTHQLLEPHRQLCSMTHIEREHPFSWVRCFTALVSYVLVLSDVLRTGPAIRDIPKELYPLEPDTAASIGPVGYAVNHLTRDNATDQAFGRYWPYKYDTTSVGIRAVAHHLRLQSWSPCLLYQVRCDEAPGLPLAAVFMMIDELVGAVNGSNSINLRSTSLFRDALHHYAMPWFFEFTDKRTIQATSYDWHSSQTAHKVLCDPRKATRPNMCAHNWANRLTVPCIRTQEECRKTRRLSEQMLNRVRILSQVYSNKTIESMLVDSTDDYTHGGMLLPGHRRADAVLFSRVRLCAQGICSTVAVDDYRFEVQTLVMNVGQWFSLIALLRGVGQAYIWLRVLLLVWICHVARHKASHEYRKSSRFAQCRTVVRTIFLVPSQVVVYGSLFPISLYYLAHLIDSPITYMLASIKFESLLGSRTWNFGGIVHYCTVSMRTVWVLGFYCHLLQAAWTRCVWSPALGIPGISEFVITFIASFTLFAQYRVLSLRNTAVLDVSEVVPSTRVHQLRSQPQDMTRTTLINLLFGTVVDWKCLLHATIAVALFCAVLWKANRVFPRWCPFQVSMATHTFVPHAASYFWPRNRLVVSWFSSLVTRTSNELKIQDLCALATSRCRALSARIVPLALPPEGIQKHSTLGRLRLQGHRVLLRAPSRTRETESVIYLMNLAAMTDPITLLQLRFFSGRQVATYESKSTQLCFLLPYDVRGSSADTGIDWEDLRLVAVVNTQDLEWDDLLRCGNYAVR